MSMLRTVKPKNARVKRALDERAPKVVEDEKTAIFVRGNNTSERVRVAMKELYALKRPHAINFSKKNAVHPFEDASSLEFFGTKNDAALLLTGLHSKKRPHDLVLTRLFDGRVLDQVEVGVDDVKPMAEFETPKASVGTRPLIVFHSDLFSTHPTYMHLRSFLLDLYNGHHEAAGIPLRAVEHVISVTAGPLDPSLSVADMVAGAAAGTSAAPATSSAPAPTATAALPRVHIRVYTIKLLASGSRVPRVALTEMGPALDLSVRRVQPAEPEMLKAALKRPKLDKSAVESGLGRKRKNIETDEMGDKVGRLHLTKQDLGKMQGRKMKALKEGRRLRAQEGADGADDDE
ncbi:rRNA-binding ribosome biosynthesis protein rpf2 [Cryptotrichosporon argae]